MTTVVQDKPSTLPFILQLSRRISGLEGLAMQQVLQTSSWLRFPGTAAPPAAKK
ncbi:hypothetical protein [Catalinimonas locisalis]|uniref:hypothetical protein n=1 Tax=Catalinimonas locisalis TaxID=3133978 RepID=UPI0031014A10